MFVKTWKCFIPLVYAAMTCLFKRFVGQSQAIVALFYPFSQFCEMNIFLLSLQTQPNTAPSLFQRGVEYGRYVGVPSWVCHGVSTIPYHTIPYHTVLYYTILYYTILYSRKAQPFRHLFEQVFDQNIQKQTLQAKHAETDPRHVTPTMAHFQPPEFCPPASAARLEWRST